MSKVRTLIVDDSAAMRAALHQILSSDPEIEVVGAAPEPHAARALIRALNPDVVTLDVEMPGMDGLSFLEKIMRLRPMPVVMCSAATAHGTDVAIEAMRLGAVDCIAKPSGSPLAIRHDAAEICRAVKEASRTHVRTHRRALARPIARGRNATRDTLIAIGASTGGVEALFHILSRMPEDSPPILIVQHMPEAFTDSFARRLDAACKLTVREARDGMAVARGLALLAPGTHQHMQLSGGMRGCVRLVGGDPIGGHRPAVDMLFQSVAPLGPSAIGVILTGMGRDGAQGLLAMRAAGARTLGQSADSCVVYGMPRAAAELGAVEQEYDLAALPEAILAACGTV
jgi:two-component system, chemotaxis family, protein-glutamate methylesterase/glutaminase